MDPLRLRRLGASAVRRRGSYVLYWMIAARRTRWSYALDHAIDRARELGVPLLVLEALRVDYPWASDRLHRFVRDGMDDNRRAFARTGITYVPYVEPAPRAGQGLVEAFAIRASLIVTDYQPGFFLPRMVEHLAARVDVPVEEVDGCGLAPVRAFDRAFATAASYRRVMQRVLPAHLVAPPRPAPLARLPRLLRDAELPRGVARRWPSAAPDAVLPIDHDVGSVPYPGGERAARATLDVFVNDRLARYDEHSHPDADATSGLSPYLHFGHISPHEVFARCAGDWDASRLGPVNGSRAGWWGLAPPVEGFLDELVTWRELAYNFCAQRRDYDRYGALPAWARATLAAHAKDPRPVRYSRAELAEARTYDPVWNAAQRELVADGRIHGYLRMLWGKKILEWSPTPQQALATMIELNNRYAVDGRDPSSYGGILWALGLFDRPWGPVRPVFGTVRYMSSTATTRKLRMKRYLARWGNGEGARRGAREEPC